VKSDFLKQAILRHLEETRHFISNLTNGKTVADLFENNIVKPDQILL